MENHTPHTPHHDLSLTEKLVDSFALWLAELKLEARQNRELYVRKTAPEETAEEIIGKVRKKVQERSHAS